MSIKRRVENLENVNCGYLIMEGILEILDLEAKVDLTLAENARLKVLSSLPLEPRLLEVMASLSERANGNRTVVSENNKKTIGGHQHERFKEENRQN